MNPTLLFANPSRELCGIYQYFFGKKGFQILTAHSGLGCLEQLRLHRPAVLVIELELPWGGGDGVVEVMREDRGLADVPVILISEKRSRRRLHPKFADGVSRWLERPVSLADIHRAILEVCPNTVVAR